MHKYEYDKKWTLDSIRYSLLVTCVDVRCSRNFPKDGRSYSYRAAIRYFVSENQGKVTCKIGLCDNFLGLCVFFSLHIGLLVPCIYIFKGKQIHTEKVIIMSDLGPAKSIVVLATT